MQNQTAMKKQDRLEKLDSLIEKIERDYNRSKLNEMYSPSHSKMVRDLDRLSHLKNQRIKLIMNK